MFRVAYYDFFVFCVAKEFTLSCGWALIPIGLLEEQIDFKEHDVELKGGTVAEPFAFDPRETGTRLVLSLNAAVLYR